MGVFYIPNPPVNEASMALLCKIFECGGMLWVSLMFPPTIESCPMVIRPSIDELLYTVTLSSSIG